MEARKRKPRKPDQVEKFYEEVRKELRKTCVLMDNKDPLYQPMLECECCRKATRHFSDGESVTKTSWFNMVTGEPISTIGPKQMYRCGACGARRPYGVPVRGVRLEPATAN